MVEGFFAGQWDFIEFSYGIAFVLLACMVPALIRSEGRRLPWLWLGVFGLTHALGEWADLLAVTFPQSAPLQVVRLSLLAGSFLCLLEFGRTGATSSGGGRKLWVYAVLLPLASAGAFAGQAGMETSIRYGLALPGGLWAAWALLRFSRDAGPARRPFATAAAAMALYALTCGLAVPRSTFFLASAWNAESFVNWTGVPVQALRGSIVAVLAASLWIALGVRRRFARLVPAERKAWILGLWLGIGLVALLALGWVATDFLGRETDRAKRSDLLGHARIGAAAVNPARLLNLAGSATDLSSPDYQRVKQQLRWIRQASAPCRFCYLVTRRGGKIIFLADSEPEDSPDYSPPGEEYAEASPVLKRAFEDGMPAVEGPLRDRWGVWVSGFVPIRDPATGNLLAVFGVDEDGRGFQRSVSLMRLVPISITLLVSLLVLGFFVGIQKMREDETKLASSERQYRGMFEDNAAVMILMDPESGDIVDANAAAAAFYGFPREAMKRLKVWDINTSPAEKILADAEAVRRGEKQAFLFQHRLASGELRDVEVHSVLLPFKGRDVMYSIIHDVTERKRVEESLRLSEERYRHFVQNVPIGLYRTAPDGRILMANQALLGMLGYEGFEELASRNLDREGFEDMAARERFKRELEARGEVIGVEGTWVRKDGTPVFVRENARLIRDASGGSFYEGTVEDITAQRLAQDHLIERERRFQAVINTALDAVVVIDHDGCVAYWNPAAEKTFGYSLGEALGKKVHDLVAPDRYRDAYLFGFEAFARTGEGSVIGKTLEMDGRRKDGSEFPVELSIAAFSWEGRWNAVAVLRDTSERKKAEAILRESEEKYRSVVNSVKEVIFQTDAAGRWTFLNPAWADLTGFGVEESLGKPAINFLQAEDRMLQLEDLIPLIRGERESLRQEFRYITKDGGTLWIEVFARRVADEKGRFAGTSGTFADMTHRHEVERLKSEFVSTVSHELRTPLTSIQGSLGLLVGGVAGPLPDQAYALIEIAHKNSERLVRLINDILDIEKIESGKMTFSMRPLEVAPLVEHVLTTMHAYGEQYGVTFDLANSLPGARVKADPDRIAQVLTNFLSNAAKFSPAGETVDVSISRRDGQVRLEVGDRGPGIPENFRPLVFQKFAQADVSDARTKGGTGLGLSICKAMVEKQGGVIGFASEPGKGTTFFFELPELPSPEIPPAPSISDRPRVLVCEDDMDNAQVIRSYLAESGFDVDLASGASQARLLLAGREYVAATIDLLLPDGDGVAFIRELRASEGTRNLPLVVVSVKAQQGREELGGDAYLVMDWLDKPISPPRLIAAVRRAAEVTRGRAQILHVESDRDILQVVSVLLKDIADVTYALTFQSARSMVQSVAFDLVILEPRLPDGSGLDLLPLLRSGTGKSVPIVVFSGEEWTGEAVSQADALLVKSRASNRDLLESVRGLLRSGRS